MSLIIVANRLPVSISKTTNKDGTNEYTFNQSSGGLASALSGCKKSMDFMWIGWPGFDVPEQDRDYITTKLRTDFACSPVFLSADVAERYYNGFSNSILWPLFHYLPGEMSFNEDDWAAYRQANLHFAEAIKSMVKPGDIVWVQDYHLCLVPVFLRDLLGLNPNSMGEHSREVVTGMFDDLQLQKRHASIGVNGSHAKERVDNVQIGFFLHTPFPSSEVYRVLPVRKEILLGILHCDLIGFHTYDYARHFLSSVSRLLRFKCSPNKVEVNGHVAHVGTFPIGIEPDQFLENLEEPSVVQRVLNLKRRFEGVKVIVGVDRLDYIKGVPQKLLALDTFLEEHPEWIGKVVLVQVAVPTRQDVEEYQNLRASVNELVGRINGRFGTVEFVPIHFLHKSVNFQELCALYAFSDVCLVTSTRDGMNLVSYEYIATQQKQHGVLILSEFAGAAHSLNGSIIVNPYNTEETANAINKALTMSEEEKAENHRKLFRYVAKYTAQHWGTEFVNELQQLKAEKENMPEEDELVIRQHRFKKFASVASKA